jgi:predicted ATPase
MRDGVVIAGRYRIRRAAGEGGMGTVFEAWDDARGVPVAVKTWRAQTEGDQRASVRLAREAEALAEVRHPAVVRYVDHGVLPDHGTFLVIDWVPGQTLAARLTSTGISPADAVRLAARLADGLVALHARGVVHRDLKPSNVMLPDPDPANAVIVDLGIARLGAESDLTRTGAHLGTPRYMAPEQIRSARTVDGRADVFALGCILLEALTGRPAFEGSDPVAVLARILFEAPPLPTARRPELPKAFDGLLRHMLAREPGRRPTAPEVVQFLAEVSEGLDRESFAELPAVPEVAGREAEPTTPFSTQAGDERFVPGSPPSFRVAEGDARETARRVLPRADNALFGRAEERRRLSALLAAKTRIVTVWGGPGVGKTRLVNEVVRELVEEAPRPAWDTLVYGDLSDAQDADDVVRILAREAGVSLEAPLAPEVALGRALGRLGRVLLVADPVEHVASAFAASVRAWKSAAPDLQVVAVSRARFNPPDAVALEVGPLSTDAGTAVSSPAAALFVDRMGQLVPESGGVMADEGKRELVEQMVRLLAGVPLAIELYAARVSVLGLSGLLARAAPGSASLPTLDMSQGAMRSAVAWSWNLLDANEQQALAQCAAFRGGFDAVAAEAVVRIEKAPGATLELVQSLREKSLLVSSVAEGGHDARLSMLPAVREFAAEQLARAENVADVLARHAAHYATLFYPPKARAPEALPRLEREADNLLAAAELAVSSDTDDPTPGLACLIALEPAMLARGAVGSFRALLDRAVEPGATEDTAPSRELRAKARQIRARLEAPGGGSERARADLELCLEEARRARDAHFEATVWVDLGVAFHLGRALDAAKRCYETAVRLLRPLDDVVAEGRAIGNLGALAHDKGALSEAAASYRDAIALLEDGGEAPWRANFTANLALVEQELGHLPEARELYERAVSLLEPVRDARLLAIAVGNFGVLELEVGAPAAALAAFERSRLLLGGSSDRRSEGICQSRIGAAYALLGRPDDAAARVSRAERLAMKASDPVALEAVTLVRGLVSLSRARAAKDESVVRMHVEEVKRAIVRARAAVHDGRPVHDQSDDVRATLRIIEKNLPEVETPVAPS